MIKMRKFLSVPLLIDSFNCSRLEWLSVINTGSLLSSSQCVLQLSGGHTANQPLPSSFPQPAHSPSLGGCEASTLLRPAGPRAYPSLLPHHQLSSREFQKNHVLPLTERAASYLRGFRSEHIQIVFIFHSSPMCPVLKLFHLKNIFTLLF